MDFVLSCRLVNMISTRLVDFRSSCVIIRSCLYTLLRLLYIWCEKAAGTLVYNLIVHSYSYIRIITKVLWCMEKACGSLFRQLVLDGSHCQKQVTHASSKSQGGRFIPQMID